MANTFNDGAMGIIRQRWGLEANDTSEDRSINGLHPLVALREIAGWKLGSPDWADSFIGWANSVGLKLVDENGNEVEAWSR